MTRHYYDVYNILSNAEGIWVSDTLSKVVMYIAIGCILYTVIFLSVYSALAFGK